MIRLKVKHVRKRSDVNHSPHVPSNIQQPHDIFGGWGHFPHSKSDSRSKYHHYDDHVLSLQGKVPELNRYLSWNRGVPVASRRGQILLAVFCSRFAPAACHCFNSGTVSTQGLCLVISSCCDSCLHRTSHRPPVTVKVQRAWVCTTIVSYRARVKQVSSVRRLTCKQAIELKTKNKCQKRVWHAGEKDEWKKKISSLETFDMETTENITLIR